MITRAALDRRGLRLRMRLDCSMIRRFAKMRIKESVKALQLQSHAGAGGIDESLMMMLLMLE
jgi:hypothetical protein